MFQSNEISKIEKEMKERGFTIKKIDQNAVNAVWPNYEATKYPGIEIRYTRLAIQFKATMLTKSYTMFHRQEFLEFANFASADSLVANYFIQEDTLFAFGYLIGNYDETRFDFFIRMWEEDMKKLARIKGVQNFLASFQ